MTNEQLLRAYPQDSHIYVDTADAALLPADCAIKHAGFVAKFRFGEFWTLVFKRAD